MIYYINFLSKYFFPFNVIKYITFRSGCAFITSFLFVLIFWKFTLNRLRQLQLTEKIDMYGHAHLEEIYKDKKGTPTMGGILIIFSAVFSILLWVRLDNCFMWLVLFNMVVLGVLGLIDDLRKTRKGKGLSRKEKLLSQILVGLIVGFLMFVNRMSTNLDLPFFKNIVIDLGYFYIFWVILVIVSSSNAVNFTDGLDGLAIGALVINFLIFGLLSYITGHINIANYLFLPYIKEAAELSIICFALVGAGLGFLWFNSYPAQIFMGDVGALSLGGTIGLIALLIKKEILLIISGGLFVIEALSVIIQILNVKLFGKKVFKAAPIHHHLQLLGLKESKIIIRLWILCIILAVFTLLTLKLR